MGVSLYPSPKSSTQAGKSLFIKQCEVEVATPHNLIFFNVQSAQQTKRQIPVQSSGRLPDGLW